MRKTVLTFGLLSGALAIATMLATIPFLGAHRYELADVLGYTSIVLSALVVYFGIRSYRERAGTGGVTFGRGLAVGVLISLVSWAVYAVAFELVYFVFVPDFGETLAACMVERARATGGTDADVLQATQQAQTLKGLYDNPVTNAALTFATSVPIGLAVSAISAAILRRKGSRAGRSF